MAAQKDNGVRERWRRPGCVSRSPRTVFLKLHQVLGLIGSLGSSGLLDGRTDGAILGVGFVSPIGGHLMVWKLVHQVAPAAQEMQDLR